MSDVSGILDLRIRQHVEHVRRSAEVSWIVSPTMTTTTRRKTNADERPTTPPTSVVGPMTNVDDMFATTGCSKGNRVSTQVVASVPTALLPSRPELPGRQQVHGADDEQEGSGDARTQDAANTGEVVHPLLCLVCSVFIWCSRPAGGEGRALSAGRPAMRAVRPLSEGGDKSETWALRAGATALAMSNARPHGLCRRAALAPHGVRASRAADCGQQLERTRQLPSPLCRKGPRLRCPGRHHRTKRPPFVKRHTPCCGTSSLGTRLPIKLHSFRTQSWILCVLASR